MEFFSEKRGRAAATGQKASAWDFTGSRHSAREMSDLLAGARHGL